MTIETVTYGLKSNPEKTITIPRSLVNGANRLMVDAINAKDANDLSLRIQKYDELKQYPIFSDALSFNSCLNRNAYGCPELDRKGDTLYLKYCLYNMYDLVEKGKLVEHNEEEHNGLINMMIPIMNTLRRLENVDEGKKTSGDYFGEGKK